MTAEARRDDAAALRPGRDRRCGGDARASADAATRAFLVGGWAFLPDPAAALAAARGFAEGNGYLTGQVVDRRA
jgi:hypothetical protein